MPSPFDPIYPPWTADQVRCLNAFQRRADFRPFTCPRGHSRFRDGILVATERGWRCRVCGYRANWAHRYMAEPLPRSFARLHGADMPPPVSRFRFFFLGYLAVLGIVALVHFGLAVLGLWPLDAIVHGVLAGTVVYWGGYAALHLFGYFR